MVESSCFANNRCEIRAFRLFELYSKFLATGRFFHRQMKKNSRLRFREIFHGEEKLEKFVARLQPTI